MKKVRQNIYEYTAVFELNENGGYTVMVPALPGLVTEGKDLEDSRSMVEDAIRCYIEGLKIMKKTVPEEKGMAHVRVSVHI